MLDQLGSQRFIPGRDMRQSRDFEIQIFDLFRQGSA